MKLSKREKILLGILAFVLLLGGGVMGLLKPSWAAYTEAKRTLEETEAKKDEIQMILPALADIEDRLHTEEARKWNESFFYRDLQDVFIDRTVTALAAESGVALTTVFIDDPVLGAVQPFGGAAFVLAPEEAATAEGGGDPYADVNTAEDAADQTENTKKKEQTESGYSAPLYRCRVEGVGTESACVAYLAGLNLLGQSAYVSDFSITRQEDAEGGYTGQYAVQATIQFYFLQTDMSGTIGMLEADTEEPT